MTMLKDFLADVHDVLVASQTLEQIASITASTQEHNNEIDRARDHLEACMEHYLFKWKRFHAQKSNWNG